MDDGPLFAREQTDTDDKADTPEVWSVAALNRQVRLNLEQGWADVWVQGEIADISRAATGHVYFSLNDEEASAQLRAVMFRGDARRSRAKLQRGERVRVRGRLSLYEPRGSFQMICRTALPAGEGDLAAQFRKLRAKIEAEGLTDPARKRTLPLLPRTVGIVTSAHGAAMHDVIRVASGRCPVRLVVASTPVQGADAPRGIVAALEALQQLDDLDVVIVTRGGGSAEDLWAFNDEGVARSIAACRVPVVSGVGHETDVTLADLVADLRAATPSNAAELVCPERTALVGQLEASERALARAMETRVGRERLRLSRLEAGLDDPRHTLQSLREALQQQARNAEQHVTGQLRTRRTQLADLAQRLGRHAPRTRLRTSQARLGALRDQLRQTPELWLRPRRELLEDRSRSLHQLAEQQMQSRRHRLTEQVARLQALSPLAVLARGYAIALHDETGKAVRSASEAKPGDLLQLRLHEGQLKARVED